MNFLLKNIGILAFFVIIYGCGEMSKSPHSNDIYEYEAFVNTTVDLKYNNQFEWTKGGKESDLAVLIHNQVIAGELEAFNKEDESISKEEVASIGNSTDTILTTDPVSMEESFVVVKQVLNEDNLNAGFERKIQFNESIIPIQSSVEKIWIRLTKYTETGKVMGNYPLYYVNAETNEAVTADNALEAYIKCGVNNESQHEFWWTKGDERNSLAEMIYLKVLAGEIKAYNSENDQELSRSDVQKIDSSGDTILVTDPITLEQKQEVLLLKLNTKMVQFSIGSQLKFGTSVNSIHDEIDKIWIVLPKYSDTGYGYEVVPLYYVMNVSQSPIK